ncbi:MAG: hypothetical protein IPK64_15470 [bacterium]|nr:hypothetical protein [bacterium]
MSNRSLSLLALACLSLVGGLPVMAAAAAHTDVAAAATAAAAMPPARADFSGLWQLDPKASDDPATLGPGPGRGPGGGRGGEGGSRGRGRGGMGGGPSPDPSGGRTPGEGFDGEETRSNEHDDAASRRSAREFGRMEIFQAGDEFNLTDGMQVSRSLRIGGEPIEVFTPRGTVLAAVAWDGTSLVLTERDPQGQVRRTRQLMLSADRSTLTIKEIRHLPGQDGNQTATMVYRRQEDADRP